MIGMFLLAMSAITPAMPMPMGATPLVSVVSSPNTLPRIYVPEASWITVVALTMKIPAASPMKATTPSTMNG